MTKLVDGVYTFIGHVLEVVQAAGVQRSDVLAFQALAEGVQSGSIAPEKAAEIARQIGAPFGALWDWTGKNAAALSLLITILALLIAIYSARSSAGPFSSAVPAWA